ncbi:MULTISPECIES: hypothetical protein [unclassified Psychrobacter]|uniref:hypothetical protein n=1 Tax=unclassified Psychrobacter TaxID=196806 RepID=UPI003FCF8246
MKLNILTAAVLTSGLAMAATSANAGMTTDRNGNVGYDTYDECVMAVKDGSAKFYTPYTYQNPMRRAGEVSVAKMSLSEVMIPQSVVNNNNLRTSDYEAGACDMGVGQSNGRYGVSGALVGKYVPFASDMPVNVYMDRNGNPVRVTMQQCDNHFGSNFPTPVISEVKAPEAQLAIKEDRSMEAVVIETKRTIRPTQYQVSEVIIAPSDQVQRVNTAAGTRVAVETADGRTVYVGQEADAQAIRNTDINQTYPVIRVPDNNMQNNMQQRIIDPNTGRTIIVE